MAQGISSFQYEREKTNSGMTALGGLPVYLAQVIGLSKSIDRYLGVMDAVLVETSKTEALHCYQGYKSYQPLNTWWAEAGLVKAYRVSRMVTNMDWDGEKLIHWQRKRCGKGEEAHAVMKSDLAGGKLPSG